MNKEISKIECRLKVLGYPLESIQDVITHIFESNLRIQVYLTLVSDRTLEDLHTIVLLKGGKKSELHHYKI